MAFSFSTPSPFQNPQTQQQQTSLFSSFPKPQQQQQKFRLQPYQQQLLQPQHQHMYLYTTDKSLASYSTKWADLHPDSQKFLLLIEERILEYKDESQRLDQCSRLYDSSMLNNSFELVTNNIKQELGGASSAMSTEKVSMTELMDDVKIMLWNTEKAVRSYMILKLWFLRQNSSTASNNISTNQITDTSQSNSSSMAPLYGFYAGLPKRPSSFMQYIVERFEKYLSQCCQMIQEFEQMVLMDYGKKSSSSGLLLTEHLPKVISNVHHFFVHVAAKVENLHQNIELMKTAYLADQRRRGEGNNPFVEADRRENAKQEAAAKHLHPTLNLHTNTSISAPPPSTHGAGLFASSSIPSLPSNVQQQPSLTSFSSGGSGLSLISAPAASAYGSSLFSAPVTYNTNTGSNLFAIPAASVVSTPQSASLFGTAQTSSIFVSTPAVQNSLFSTPTLNTGGQAGKGASFGATSKSTTRSKSRRR